MNPTNNPHLGLISVAGIIGAGKTTLARRLADLIPARLILEEFDVNPFLPRQIAGDPMAALPSELFFLLSRAKQLCPEHLQPHPKLHLNTGFSAVSDYIFQKNRIFARLLLNPQLFDIFDLIEAAILPIITPPSLVLYLKCSVDACFQRIHTRNRNFEKPISRGFLEQLSEAYEELFETWDISPVICIDSQEYDFREESSVQDILGRIHQSLK